MDRAAAILGLLALSGAIGGLLIGEIVVVPLLASSSLIDANLAKTLTAPVHLRCAEIVLASAIVLALVAPRFVANRVVTTLALLAMGCAALHRFVLLPRLYDAWARADLVAGRPTDRIAEARHVADQAQMLAAAIALVLCTIAVLAALARRRIAAPRLAAAVEEPIVVAPATTAA